MSQTQSKSKKVNAKKDYKVKDHELENISQRNNELEDQLKRALADYHNLERRVEEERKLLSQLSSALLIEKLLTVMDNLENAQKHINDEGLAIVIKQIKDIMESENVTEIPAERERFDPNIHEAIETKEGKEEGKIVKVLRKGYKLGDKVLRVAQVVVEKPIAQEIIQEVAENV